MGPGTRVLVYREGPNKWEGPYMVEGSDGKLLRLNIKDGLKLFSEDKVKVHTTPITPEIDRLQAAADVGTPGATTMATDTAASTLG